MKKECRKHTLFIIAAYICAHFYFYRVIEYCTIFWPWTNFMGEKWWRYRQAYIQSIHHSPVQISDRKLLINGIHIEWCQLFTIFAVFWLLTVISFLINNICTSKRAESRHRNRINRSAKIKSVKVHHDNSVYVKLKSKFPCKLKLYFYSNDFYLAIFADTFSDSTFHGHPNININILTGCLCDENFFFKNIQSRL